MKQLAKQTSTRYVKRDAAFKSSNFQFNKIDNSSTSYGWWLISKKIGDILVYNSFSYSNSTSKHQNKTYTLLESLNPKKDILFIEAPKGLQNLNSALYHYKFLIEDLQQKIMRPRSHKKTNKVRLDVISTYETKIDTIKTLIKLEKKD